MHLWIIYRTSIDIIIFNQLSAGEGWTAEHMCVCLYVCHRMFSCVPKPDAPAFCLLTSCVPLSWQCVCVNTEFDFLWLIWLINGVTVALWDVQPCACISPRTYNPRAGCCSISRSCCASTSQMFLTWEKESLEPKLFHELWTVYPVSCINTVSGFRSINGAFTLKFMPLPHNFIHSNLVQSRYQSW